MRNKPPEEDAPCVTVGLLFPDGWNSVCATIIQLRKRGFGIDGDSSVTECALQGLEGNQCYRGRLEMDFVLLWQDAYGWNRRWNGLSWNDGVDQRSTNI
jgi:hypothetical protein